MGNYYGAISFVILLLSKVNCCMKTGQHGHNSAVSQNFVPLPPPHTLGESTITSERRLSPPGPSQDAGETNIMEKYKIGAIPDEFLSGSVLTPHDVPQEGGTIPRNRNSGESFLSRLSVDITPPAKNRTVRFITIKNVGRDDDAVKMSVYNADGRVLPVYPSEFPLASGSSTQIPLNLEPLVMGRSNFEEKTTRSSSPPFHPLEGLVTVHARGKRDSIKRSFFFEGEQPGPGLLQPFCVDKDVSGTCRYRSDPEDCFRFQWTAYATIYNKGGFQTISSIPLGIQFDQGEHGRVRVYLTVSCCNPIVQFIGTDSYHPGGGDSCVVDVRELQGLHPGEIVGIVLGVLALIIIIVVIIILCLRKRRKETLNKNIHVGIAPSRCRSREMMCERSQSQRH